jgi:probable phosphoglycerate mutase
LIYLVRHGQTAFNVEGRWQGHADSPLTRLGERQARAVGRGLRPLVEGRAYRIVASPLGRAQATAGLIAEQLDYAGPIALEPRLMELGLGQWEAMTGEDIDFVYPGMRDGASAFDWFFKAPGGERHAEFSGRIADWLAEQAEGDAIVITVSHGVTSRVLRGLYAGADPVEALKGSVPQDAFFRLHQGCVEQIDCALEEA